MTDPLLAQAGALGLVIAPEWEASVLSHLHVLLRLGAAVADGLPDALDPLPLDHPPAVP